MKTSEIRRALLRRWPATLVVVAIAIAMALVIHEQLSSTPTGQATTQILVDSPSSSLVNVNVNSAGLTAQASVLAQAMTSQAVLQQIAKSAGVPVGSVSAQGPFNGAGEVLDIPTPSEARANQVVSIKSAYHVSFVAQQDVPIITVTITGPNPSAAGHIADAVLPGTNAWLSTIAATSTVKKAHQLVLRQLGDAQAGPVNSRSAELIAAVAAIAVLILGLLGVVLVERRRQERRELRRRVSEIGDLEQAFERDRAFGGEPDPPARRRASASKPREQSKTPRRAAVQEPTQESKTPRRAAVQEPTQESKTPRRAAVQEPTQEPKTPRRAAVQEPTQEPKTPRRAAVQEPTQEPETPRQAAVEGPTQEPETVEADGREAEFAGVGVGAENGARPASSRVPRSTKPRQSRPKHGNSR